MTDYQPVLHGILPHRHQPQILLTPQDDGWTLPSMGVPVEPGMSPYGFFAPSMRTELVSGCHVSTLYCAYFEEKNEEHGYRSVFVLENLDADFQPSDGARWFTHAEIDALTLTDAYLRPVIDAYFREQEMKQYPAERPPWAFPGWLNHAGDWIRAQVEANGWQLDGEIGLVRKWSITCVLKVPTTVGDLYFKAVPPIMAREIEVTRFLAAQFPEHLPSIVAYDAEQRWLLMRDFGQALLRDSREIADWERMIREFAALQVATHPQIDTLRNLNALYYPLEELPEGFNALLTDEVYLHPGRHISAEEIERVRGYVPQIRRLIEELVGYDIPETILHGDFHSGNTALQGEKIIFFDWTDVMVGCPLLDMAFFFDGVGEILTDVPDADGHLQEVYLEGLASLAPIETLRKALPLGQTVGFLQLVVHNYDLLRHLEPSEHWTLDVIGFFTKQLLIRLETVHELSPSASS
jgi:hypothetical protein